MHKPQGCDRNKQYIVHCSTGTCRWLLLLVSDCMTGHLEGQTLMSNDWAVIQGLGFRDKSGSNFLVSLGPPRAHSCTAGLRALRRFTSERVTVYRWM